MPVPGTHPFNDNEVLEMLEDIVVGDNQYGVQILRVKEEKTPERKLEENNSWLTTAGVLLFLTILGFIGSLIITLIT